MRRSAQQRGRQMAGDTETAVGGYAHVQVTLPYINTLTHARTNTHTHTPCSYIFVLVEMHQNVYRQK